MTTEAERLTKGKRIRGGHRAVATRILSRIDEALRHDPLDIDDLSRLKLSLNEKLETLKSLDSAIIEGTPDDKLVEEIEEADEYKENIYRTLTRVEKATRVMTTVASVSDPPTITPTIRVMDPAHKVKLPKLELPSFNGNIMKWSTFLNPQYITAQGCQTWTNLTIYGPY